MHELPNNGMDEDALRMEKDRTYMNSPCKVGIHQFYGIEINDFAVQVSRAALWIANCQMNDEMEEKFDITVQGLPLSRNNQIVCQDALTNPWELVVPSHKLNYIIGNPPFNGSQVMDDEQKKSMKEAMSAVNDMGKKVWKSHGKMDFVCGWYAKAAEYMKGHRNIRAAFVSTNSLTQGEQVFLLWKPLVEQYGLKISFAWRTFVWENEADENAHVHCVIIGFYFRKTPAKEKCYIYEEGKETLECDMINGYLFPAKHYFLSNARKHIQCNLVHPMRFGSMPNDCTVTRSSNGKEVPQLRLSEEERSELLSKFPELQPYILQILGGDEFINGNIEYCIWISKDAPLEVINHPALKERFDNVRKQRKSSTRKETQALADTPYLFGERRQPKDRYLLVPGTSSENRKYIPIGFVEPNIICSNAALSVDACSLWEFGVLTSSLHNAWIKIVSGRLKSDYRYSASVVYNNFPWPEALDDSLKEAVEKTAQAILDVRSEYADNTMAELYAVNMSPALLAAHQANDKAVINAYAEMGIRENMTDEEMVLVLLERSVAIANPPSKKQKKIKNKRKRQKAKNAELQFEVEK